MSGQDMRKLMEMADGERLVYVVSYGGVPVRATLDENFANTYAEEYRKVTSSDPKGPKEVTVHEVKLS